jgi:hypothetical protein
MRMMNQDNEVDHIATMQESVDEWRFNVGDDRANQAWLLHDFDVWVKNPFYVGPPQPHPEDEQFDDAFLAQLAAQRVEDDRVEEQADEAFWARMHEAEMGLL